MRGRPPVGRGAVATLSGARSDARRRLRKLTAHGDAPALIGRERELAVIAAVLEQARAGRRGARVIAGEAGVGRPRRSIAWPTPPRRPAPAPPIDDGTQTLGDLVLAS